MNHLNLCIDPRDVMVEIERNGFSIVSNAVSIDFILAQRSRWLEKIKKDNVDRKFVRGNLILGEKNFLSYSDIPGWCMYRNYEFLWNESDDLRALNLHIDLHKFRNRMQGFAENFGLEYNSRNYGIYISTSLYEINRGFLSFHADGHGNLPIIHYMLPLTFKGQDYSSGGLYCQNAIGQECDIDALINPGDLIFFDGRMRHGVKKIESDSDKAIGRLAVFSIPTFFAKDAVLSGFKRTSAVYGREIANKLGLIDLY